MLYERLYQKIRGESVPVHGCSISFFDSYLNAVRFSEFSFKSNPSQWQAPLRILEQELRRAALYGFTQEEFERTKKQLLKEAQNNQRAKGTQNSSILAQDLVRTCSGSLFQSPDQRLEFVENFVNDIELKEVETAFKDAWSIAPEAWIFVSGNALEADTEIKTAIHQAYVESQRVPVEPWVEAPLKPWSYTDFGPPTAITQKTFVEDLGLTQLTFANNVRVNLKPTQQEPNDIMFSAHVGSGLLELPGEDPSLISLFSGAFLGGALQNHSCTDLIKLFSGQSVDLRSDVRDNAFSFWTHATSEDLEAQMQFFVAYLQDPGYRSESLTSFRSSQNAFYDNLYSDMDDRFGAWARLILHNEDPRFALPERNTVLGLNLEDLRNWIQGPLTSGYLEVSLVGDFDLDKAIGICKATVGALPPRQKSPPPYEDRRSVRFPEGPREERIYVETQDPSAKLLIAFPGVDLWQLDDDYGLDVLMQVVDNYLNETIREEEGLVYGIHTTNSSSDTFRDYGQLTISTSVEPQALESVTKLIEIKLEELKTRGISQKDFDCAINPILSQIPSLLKRNGFWTNYVHGSALYPEQLDWMRTHEKRFRALTPEFLNQLSKKYLDWNKRIILRGEPIIEQPPQG